MATYITSDTHFGHKSIIEFANRPFQNVEEHDKELIKRWNEKVSPNDEVYHLGDFLFVSNRMRIKYLYEVLNGKIYFIEGNHDKLRGWMKDRFEWVKDRYEFKYTYEDRVYSIILDHYPIQDWNKRFHNSIHFHGHTHGLISPMNNRMEVGVDNPLADYSPILLEDAVKWTIEGKQFEKFQERIRIKACSNEHYWYSNEIGNVYDVIKIDDDHYLEPITNRVINRIDTNKPM